MAGNPLIDVFKIKDLRERILFTLGILLVFRIGTAIPVPGINLSVVKDYFDRQAGGGQGIADYLDLFAGGGFKQFSIFMLGIMPYISTSIIMQLLLLIFPSLKKISEEDGGRKKIQRYTRYGTAGVCIIQAFAFMQMALSIRGAIVPELEGLPFTILFIATVTTGTMFLMWMGEQINQRGIGNGISLIIFAGIVARIPGAIYTLFQEVWRGGTGALSPVFVIVVFGVFVGVVVLVIYEQQGQRKIPVHYAKRIIGRKMYGSQNTYIPFKINPSGVIPVIFASAIMTFPIQIASSFGKDIAWLQQVANFLQPGELPYSIIYVLMIIFFSFFYTQVTLNPIEIAKQIRENGGTIPGIRSEKIEEYLSGILNRIVLPGSLFLAFIAIIPTIIQNWFNFPAEVAYLLGGTSLLIMVGVDLDTMSQIEGHLRMHHHDGLTKKGRLKSRNL